MPRFSLALLFCLASTLVIAADAPLPPCDCKPMTVTVRSASGRTTSDVTVKNFNYSLATITVTVGDTVTWTNNDSAPHTATSTTGLFDTGTLTSGLSASVTFSTAGTFPYFCTIHPFMTGTVIVQQPTPPTLKNLTATATVATNFRYTITADGTKPITFGATLPPGLTLNGAAITGQFPLAGTVTIPLTATNSIGSDAKDLVVTVNEKGVGSASLTGTWSGKMKTKQFSQLGTIQKPTTSVVTLTVAQTGGILTATLANPGSSTPFPDLAGQTGNSNLWLTGNSGAQGFVLSAHLNKKGDAMTGLGIRTNPDSDEEVMISLKKQQ